METKDLEKDEALTNAMRIFLHEIKNPITALMFQSESLKESLPKKYQSDIEAMDKEIHRLSDLVKGASDFLKNPKGNPEKINVSDLLQKIISTFSCKISFACPSNVEVFFDRDRFRSVFENLIKNACESKSESDAHVEVVVSEKPSCIVVNVMDRGTGVLKDTESKLFNFGFTTKEEGSGIGLFLVKQFVEAQNGTIKLYPRENGGTVAEVVLPRK